MSSKQEATVVEFSAKLTREEIGMVRAAITKMAPESDWKDAAIKLFASLRQRRSRYEVRQLGRDYNAV
jgi:hypothetical protein